MFVKAYSALHFRIFTGVFIAGFMIVMILAPVIVRFSEKAGNEILARVTAYIGFTWMAVLFIFFAIHIFIDVLRLFIFLTGLITRIDFTRITSAYGCFFAAAFFGSLTVSAYGFYEARNIKTERVVIESEKISGQLGRLKIVQISDVHVGTIIRNDRLQRIIDAVQKENPDILVSTGDLVDGRLYRVDEIPTGLSYIKPKYGKYAVLGNHEFYAGVANAIKWTEREGFRILRGEAVTISGVINIAGVDDPAGRPYNYVDVSEQMLLKRLPAGTFTLLLKHQPVVDRYSKEYFDLQLSGHTHNGQVFPFRYITRLFYSTPQGLSKISEKGFLYVSRGSGTWGPPIRFLTPPEITVIEITQKR